MPCTGTPKVAENKPSGCTMPPAKSQAKPAQHTSRFRPQSPTAYTGPTFVPRQRNRRRYVCPCPGLPKMRRTGFRLESSICVAEGGGR